MSRRLYGNHTWQMVVAIGLIALGSTSLRASHLDELLIDLASDDDAVQARARHLLPRESIEAVPKLVRLMAQDKERVWRSAFNVLADFCNQVSVPGREDERRLVTEQVMTLVATKHSAVVKMRGLRLLPLVTPAGYDLTPISRLLDDQELRERARVALAEMRTPESLAALRNALAKAAPPFQCALLDTLAITHDPAAVEVIKPLLAASDGQVRVAALRALSWTADPSLLVTGEKLFNAALKDGSAQGEQAIMLAKARDALLRLSVAMEDQGGHWQILVDTNLRWITSSDTQLKEAALACLGRVGDDSCVEPVLAAIKGADDPIWAIGIQALNTMRGRDVASALVAAYPQQEAKTQTALLAVLGGKKYAPALPLLSEAAKSDDAATRVQALQAIADSELPQALPILAAAAKSSSGHPAPPATGDTQVRDEKSIAQAGLLRLAAALRGAGNQKEAGQAYLAALNTATTLETRRQALHGLTACPLSEAQSALSALADNKELKADVVPALVAVAGTMAGEGKREDALKVFQQARELGGSSDTLKLIAKGMKELGADVDLSSMLGIVTSWWVVGPFDLDPENAGWAKEYITEPKVDLNARYMAGKRRLDWRLITTDADHGLVNLLKVLGAVEHAVGYAYSEVEVSQDTPAVLNVGADDSERIWVNGEKVFEHFVARGLLPDQDKVPVQLKAGKNTILMKIWQLSAGWEFCMRITTPTGEPVSFVNKPSK